MADQLHEAEIGHQRCLHDLESKRNDCQQIPTTLQAPHEHLKLLVEQLQQKVQVMEIQHQQNQQTHQTLLSQLAQAARTLTESAASLGPLSTDCPPTTR
ncbi:MAG: hypothetical protein KGQ89_09845 [Verrucomicrobia bacterium]|nr:hypothetical protein [Verrucomicrobiota bacterium]